MIVPDSGVEGALLEPVRQPAVLHDGEHGGGRRLEVLETVDEDVVEDDVVEVAALHVARGQLLRHLRHVLLLREELDEAVVRHREVLRVLLGAAE